MEESPIHRARAVYLVPQSKGTVCKCVSLGATFTTEYRGIEALL